jgi:ADP-heptose:LPS heptosyltransferase
MGRVQKRSVPLTWWKPILETPNVEFVSLQYGIGKEEDLDVMDALGYDIKRFPETDAKDYYETARLVSSCDLVITICTSVVHVAGALGVPCWVLTPKNPAWRYQNKGGMPWYRSVRLYRSPDVEQPAWRPVVDLIGADLDELVNGKQQMQRTA